MFWYKVILGTKRYTTEKITHVKADTPEEACMLAAKKFKKMKYATARRV